MSQIRSGGGSAPTQHERFFGGRYAGLERPVPGVEVYWENPKADVRMQRAEEAALKGIDLKEPVEKNEKMAQMIKDYANAKVHPDNVPLDEWEEYVILRKQFNLSYPIREY